MRMVIIDNLMEASLITSQVCNCYRIYAIILLINGRCRQWVLIDLNLKAVQIARVILY